MNWPRYMMEKRLSDGSIAYYWNPHKRDTTGGFSIGREPLGKDYGGAIARAGELNQHLDDWRTGRGESKTLDLSPAHGTLKWMVAVYKGA